MMYCYVGHEDLLIGPVAFHLLRKREDQGDQWV
jgi:hypothetical protein